MKHDLRQMTQVTCAKCKREFEGKQGTMVRCPRCNQNNACLIVKMPKYRPEVDEQKPVRETDRQKKKRLAEEAFKEDVQRILYGKQEDESDSGCAVGTSG
jgi:uncharacterized Zn finger protein (UPF0148 family)